MADTEKAKKEYEIGVLVRKEDDIPFVRRATEQHGGEFAADFQAKKIALAYPIKKEREAIFAFARFSAEPDEAKRLEHDLRTASAVLRSLITIPSRTSRPETTSAGRKWSRTEREAKPIAETKTAPARILSNEALTKKIEEMLK